MPVAERVARNEKLEEFQDAICVPLPSIYPALVADEFSSGDPVASNRIPYSVPIDPLFCPDRPAHP